jgi:hypothetical protein
VRAALLAALDLLQQDAALPAGARAADLIGSR